MAEPSVSRERLSTLLDSAGRTAEPGSLDMLRVGRNPVWRVSAAGEMFYCKICPSVAELRREASGYRLAELMAKEDDRFIAADVVAVDEEQRLLVTKQVPGSPVVEWLKAGYRIDKNPLKKRGPRNVASDALGLVCDWLRALQARSPEDCQELCDHNVRSIGERINLVLNRPYHGVTCGELLNLADLPTLSDVQDVTLIFGDCTLGNFYSDGERIGAIDFEDVGIGPTVRDFSNLRDGIEDALENLYYFTDAKLLDALYEPTESYIDVLIRLERRILRYEMYLEQSIGAAKRQKSLARVIGTYAKRVRTVATS